MTRLFEVPGLQFALAGFELRLRILDEEIDGIHHRLRRLSRLGRRRHDRRCRPNGADLRLGVIAACRQPQAQSGSNR